ERLVRSSPGSSDDPRAFATTIPRAFRGRDFSARFTPASEARGDDRAGRPVVSQRDASAHSARDPHHGARQSDDTYTFRPQTIPSRTSPAPRACGGALSARVLRAAQGRPGERIRRAPAAHAALPEPRGPGGARLAAAGLP